MIDQATIERVLDTARIEEVIGDFVALRRHGSSYIGLCPFHQDRNPSMSVSIPKQIFKCFSCGEAGNAATFLMKHEHITYPEAIRYLAKKYGIEIKEEEETPEQIAAKHRRESLFIVTEYAQKYYEELLWDPECTHLVGLSYFKERKFTDATIRKFGLGFAPRQGKSFSQSAIEAGYKKEYLVDTGLTIERENGTLADRFFDRVMFPIHNLTGRVIAFGGRIMTSDKKYSKYINSPETEIYVKNKVLYGIYFAKAAITRKKCCILVEGYTDVISMHQAGIENVVASSGTALTDGQIDLIRRFSENVTVMYDGDSAGIKASIRGIDMILKKGMKVKVVLLPPEDDPDSFAKGHTSEEIEEYIEKNQVDFITFKMDLLMEEAQKDPGMRAQLINDIISSIAVIPDQIERNVYGGMVSEKFQMKPEPILSKIRYVRDKMIKMDKARANIDSRQSEELEPEEIVPGADFSEPVIEIAEPGITNNHLAVPEKDIIYYLLKFGEYKLYSEEDLRYNPDLPPYDRGITIADYILRELKSDDILPQNPLYRKIFDAYYAMDRESMRKAVADEGIQDNADAVLQGKIIRRFSTSPDTDISSHMFKVLSIEHPLTSESLRSSLTDEELLLSKYVPKVLLTYKLRIIELECAKAAAEVKEAEKSGDSNALALAIRRTMQFGRIKIDITKMLDGM